MPGTLRRWTSNQGSGGGLACLRRVDQDRKPRSEDDGNTSARSAPCNFSSASSVREIVHANPFQRFLVSRPLVQALDPCVEVGILRTLAERAGHFADEAHLDVSAGQSVSHQELPALQSAVDVTEMIG